MLVIEDDDGFTTEWPWPSDRLLLANGDFVGVLRAGARSLAYGNLTERNRRLLDDALVLTEVEWDRWVKTGSMDPPSPSWATRIRWRLQGRIDHSRCVHGHRLGLPWGGCRLCR